MTLYSTVMNYKSAISMHDMLSLSHVGQSSSTSRIVTTNDHSPKQPKLATKNSGNNDDDMDYEQKEISSDSTSDRSDIDTPSSSNRLGSLVNRFQYYGTKTVNSNSIVMSDVASTSTSATTGAQKNYSKNTLRPTNDNDDEDETLTTSSDGADEELLDDEKDDSDGNDADVSIDDMDTEATTTDMEALLFKKEIRKNFNASLYRNYGEFKSRSQRFPSVEERVKVYMSNWYVPPILPCIDSRSRSNRNTAPMGVDGSTLIENDPRVQYNYQILVDPITKNSNTIILLRQSQQLLSSTTNFFDRDKNISSLLQLDMTPQRTRTPFVYNHTYMVKFSSDHFLQDAYKHYIPSLQRLQYPDTSLDIETLMQNGQIPPPIPILLQLGDSEQYRIYSPSIDTDIYRPFVPIIKKFRYSMSAEELERVTSSEMDELDCVDAKQPQKVEQPTRTSRTVRISDPFMRDYVHDRSTIPHHVQPIVSILSNYERHFNPLNDVIPADRSWNRKRNMAVYRGALTGTNRVTTPARMNKNDKELLDTVYCQEVPRCNLVFKHGQSEYVDAKLVASKTKDERIPATLRNVTMFGSGMNFQQMLEYKGIIMLEGNDVSTGLKWSLYSNSVVLTPKPTCTSWAMEELLVPYVHYIPLHDNLTNVEEQVKWMIEHDKEAEQIAYNGKLWMMDLVYHTDVKKDTEEIIDETFRRYMEHFVYNPELKI